MSSLRSRLFVGLTLVIVLAGLAAGGLAFLWSFDEAIEFQDTTLQHVGAFAANNPRLSGSPGPKGSDSDADLVIEEFGVGAGASDVRPPLPADLPDGLQTVKRGKREWRVLLMTRSDGSRVAVSQPTEYRDEIAHESALRTVLPLAALVPCVMVLVAVVLGRGFRPISRLAAHLNARSSDDLSKLSLADLPDEMLPFIGSINSLLTRLQILLGQQRRFIADAAHELRTPIAALSVHVDNLERVSLPPEGLERLTALKSSTRRVGHLLEQLLALARSESSPASTVSTVSFEHVLRQVVADLMPLARSRNIDLGFGRVDDVVLQADTTALAVMARNIIDNALRYSPEDGRVDVSLVAKRGNAVLHVEDTGPGIAPGDLEQVFEPFFRGNSAEGGTGLGLSIVRRIVSQLGGVISLDNISAINKVGLRVSVTLPCKDNDWLAP